MNVPQSALLKMQGFEVQKQQAGYTLACCFEVWVSALGTDRWQSQHGSQTTTSMTLQIQLAAVNLSQIGADG